MATQDGNVERSLELLWAGRSRGRRGPRAQLSVARIAEAAVRIADADGLEALSMQRIATELGYSTMAIYNHIPSKDLLLEVVADVGAGKPPELDGEFRQAVRQWAGALWAGFQRRPWILRVPLDHTPVGPHQLAWLDRLLRPLLAAGLAGTEARAAALHLTAVVRGTAQISLQLAGPRSDGELARALAGVLDPAEYPALTALHEAEAGTSSPEPGSDDELPAELGFGVDRFLDGVEAWVARTSRARPVPAP